MANPEFFHGGIDAPSLCGPGVRLDLLAANGWTHTFDLFAEGESTAGSIRQPQLVSVHPVSEYDMDPADPSRVLNPVYQDFARHELPRDRGTGLCLLLTGSCLEHHFSAVFSLYRDRCMPSRIVFDADIADRCRAPIRMLAATYDVSHIQGKSQLIDASPDRMAWSGGPLGEGLLELIADRPAMLAPPELHDSGNWVRAQAWINPDGFTQRLRYRWCWTRSGARAR
jgi:hypothetical protein